jgi:hypothetical protein
MTTESLVETLVRRVILLEPEGGNLAVEPVERLWANELEEIRERKGEILGLFKSGRLVIEGCPGDACGEVLVILDGLGYCRVHSMTIRFLRGVQ